MAKKLIPPQSESFSNWYNTLVQKAELADYAPVRGCMVIRPYGYALWEAIQDQFNKQIKAAGVKNAYFPLFIPEGFIKREKDHVEGFAPELAVVTHGGGEKLEEPLIVRPTSETIINEMYSQWVQSWRDLPLLINQWCNVVRWEKRTYLFLRTSEFLWQEGHTAHATHKEAQEWMHWAKEEYRKLYEDFLAIPVAVGKKTEQEKFAGALTTYSLEALVPSGKALQACTSHDLGQNFSKVFDIKYQNKEGKLEYVWQTSWGLSTRAIGTLIMMHGDDNGLRLPPKVAPIQIVIIPISEKKEVVKKAEELKKELAAFRVEVDTRFEQSLGFRINNWELKGVPVRIEIGEKELEKGSATIARRDAGEKEVYPLNCGKELSNFVEKLLEEIQANLFKQAKEFQEKNTVEAQSFSELESAIEQGKFVKAHWCGNADCENKIKEKTKASARVILEENSKGNCVFCACPATNLVLFSKAY